LICSDYLVLNACIKLKIGKDLTEICPTANWTETSVPKAEKTNMAAQMHYLNQHRGMMNKKKPFRALFVKYFHKRRKRDVHKMIQLVSASGM
jgi:hypothetical protein